MKEQEPSFLGGILCLPHMQDKPPDLFDSVRELALSDGSEVDGRYSQRLGLSMGQPEREGAA